MKPANLIKNRVPALREAGKIKIGMKGQMRQSKSSGKDFQPPVKLDHFIITTMEVGADGNFVQDTELMKTVAEATEQDDDNLLHIPVRLLFDDLELNFRSRFAAYQGKTVWCSGDGKIANRLNGNEYESCECPCERIDQGYTGAIKCKINGVLSVLIDGIDRLGGVWKFRTTSFNSHDALLGSLMFLHRAANGRIAGLPLNMTVTPKKVSDPAGKQQTIQVVGLEFVGTMDTLREQVLKIATAQAQAGIQIEGAEEQARKLLEGPVDQVFSDDDPIDVGDEFYPVAPEIQDPMQTDGPEQNQPNTIMSTEEYEMRVKSLSSKADPPKRRRNKRKAEPVKDDVQEDEQESMDAGPEAPPLTPPVEPEAPPIEESEPPNKDLF